jgi:hypothetical protein
MDAHILNEDPIGRFLMGSQCSQYKLTWFLLSIATFMGLIAAPSASFFGFVSRDFAFFQQKLLRIF